MKKKIIISGQLLLGGMYMKNNRKKFLLALLIIFASFFVTSCGGGGGGGSVMDAINALLGISVNHTTWEWKDGDDIVQIAFGEGTYTVKKSTDGGTNFITPPVTGNFSFNQAEKKITFTGTGVNVTSTPIESNKFKVAFPDDGEREFTKK